MEQLDMILGAQVCVISRGAVIVDACAGRISPIDASPVRTDSLFQVFEAATPVLATVALQIAAAPGTRLRLDAPLCEAWSGFGAWPPHNPLAHLSLAELLSHRSKLGSVLPPAATPEDLASTIAMETRVSRSTPSPQSALATSATGVESGERPLPAASYEGAPFGWALGGIMRAVSGGTSIEGLVESRLLRPLSITDEMLFALPGGVHERAVTHSVSLLPDDADLELIALISNQEEEDTDNSGGANAASTDGPGPSSNAPGEAGTRSTARLLSPAGLNMRRMRSAFLPGVSAHSSAHALATFYSALGGGQLLPRAVLARAAQRASRGMFAGEEATWGLGMQIGALCEGEWRHVALGHAATGGSLGFCVPQLDLAIGITLSRLTAEKTATRRILALVLHECVGSDAVLAGLL